MTARRVPPPTNRSASGSTRSGPGSCCGRRQRGGRRNAHHDLPWWDGPVSAREVETCCCGCRPGQGEVDLDHHAPRIVHSVSWTGKKFGGRPFLVEWIRVRAGSSASGHITMRPFVSQGSWIDRIGRTWFSIPANKSSFPSAWASFSTDESEWDSLEEQGPAAAQRSAGAAGVHERFSKTSSKCRGGRGLHIAV